ncbi:MAG: methylene-tetrahydromethanopterin dehydrogenase N-terminal domain-containing protein [Gemmataceae bacterium]
MEARKILAHLDTDLVPSLHDRIVALDSGADEVLSYGGVRIEHVANLVQGALFSRDRAGLAGTAILVGGNDLSAGEILFGELRKQLQPQLGLQVSLMLDSSRANTSAAATVAAASKHLELGATTALVLGGTSATGQRVARLLARAGAEVRLGSRQRDRADFIATAIRGQILGAKVSAVSTATATDAPAAIAGAQLVVAAGSAGSMVLPKKLRSGATGLKLLIDLNPVPPAGIEGVEPIDNATERDGIVCYGALAIGAMRLKIQRAAIAQLFTRNDLVLDAEQIVALTAAI